MNRADTQRTSSLATQTPARLQRESDVFGFEIFLDTFVAALATEARGLNPAEARGRVRDHPSVDADHSGIDPLLDAHCAVHILGIGECHETEFGVIGHVDALLLR